MCQKYLIFEFRKERVVVFCVMRQYHFSSLALTEADGAQPPTSLCLGNSKVSCCYVTDIFLAITLFTF